MVEEKPAYRWAMLLWLALVMFLVGDICMGVVPALFSEIEEELDLTHGQLGVIWGAVAPGAFLTSLTGGIVGDRMGVKRVVGMGLILATVSCTL